MGLFNSNIEKLDEVRAKELSDILGDLYQERLSYYQEKIIPKIAEYQKKNGVIAGIQLPKSTPPKKLTPKGTEAITFYLVRSLVDFMQGCPKYFKDRNSYKEICKILLLGIERVNNQHTKTREFKTAEMLSKVPHGSEEEYMVICMLISDELLGEKLNPALGFYTTNFLMETFYLATTKIAFFVNDMKIVAYSEKQRRKNVENNYLENFGNY